MEMEKHFKGFEREDLLSYIEFLLHNYRVADAFWYLNAEERHGAPEADRLNEAVWHKTTQLAARDIKKRFGRESAGLDGFLEAINLLPWTILVGYDFRKVGDEVHLKVSKCPPQEGRKKHGLPEYACKGVHLAEFIAFAEEIDPAIQVECVYAPPDEHPEDHYCSWRFWVE